MPGIITAILVILVLICKGIWPFGRNRIDYFDNMQQVAPLYTHLWDWMHGDASLWFDWYTGLGTNVSMSISAFSMLSPFNLMLYLVPRHLILEYFHYDRRKDGIYGNQYEPSLKEGLSIFKQSHVLRIFINVCMQRLRRIIRLLLYSMDGYCGVLPASHSWHDEHV